MKSTLLRLLPLLLLGCHEAAPPPPPVDSTRSVTPDDSADVERARCERLQSDVLATEPWPGTPELDEQRARILGRAKAEPVLFLRPPEEAPTADRRVLRYRRVMHASQYPWEVVNRLRSRFIQRPQDGRALLLREGYLYAETPELAFALFDRVAARHLFDAPRIWIQRGPQTHVALRRSDGSYGYAEGERAGKPIRLLLFDRVGTGTPPEPLHRETRGLRHRLGFDRMRVRHRSPDHLLVDLRYGDVWVPTVLRSEGATLHRECELIPEGKARAVASSRARAARQRRVASALREVMRLQIAEELPFDEPLTEYGQQDGFLRWKWESAYRLGHDSFWFQGDKYPVFDPTGRPFPPQVCIDFLTDTFERASGTWWRPQGEPRQRVVGGYDYGATDDGTLRQASRFVDEMRGSPDRFDFFEVEPRDRHKFQRADRVYDWLAEHADDFVAGDVVLVRGYVPWEKPWQVRTMHYHSFFVYEDDPVTGMPFALVGNPARPDIRTWHFEALRTPKRQIWYRVRPKLEWLEQIVSDETATDEPPPLVGRG